MQIFRRAATAVLCASIFAASTPVSHADAYTGSPKLVIMLVFDQFRGDYLDRYRADFKAKNGWNLFLRQGAHFTDCYYDYANLITAAGHSTIGTGAYTDGHGIGLNEWWEPGPDGKEHQVSSVEDPRYTIVGAPQGAPVSPGASPKNEMASTLGDELVVATQGRARVYGVSFKDRAAILTSGHTQKAAFWTDHDTGNWVTSTYWLKSMPTWVTTFNDGKRQAAARKEANVPTGSFYEKVGRTPASVSYQLDFAKALIQNEHLGANPAGVTDLLTLSISSTDILGHAMGPDSPEERVMIDAADGQLDSFFSWLDSTVGLQNVMVTFTGDHGVGPTIQTAQSYGLPARSLSPAGLVTAVETLLEQRFKPAGTVKYVLGYDQPWIQLDPAPFIAQGVSEVDAETATRDAMEGYLAGQATKEAAAPSTGSRQPDPVRTQFISTISQMKAGLLPDTDYGRREMHSYTPRMGWGVHFNLGAYQYGGYATGATHYSANSYDRHVPLDMFGAGVQPGTYHGVVAPVDIAATLASMLRINRPSAAVGKVLTEAMKPDTAKAGQ
ncbi:MAG: alkaline phosphatase family protein [Janthinobacterium lividum]